MSEMVSKHSYSDSSARIGALRASARRAPIPHFRPRTHARFHTSSTCQSSTIPVMQKYQNLWLWCTGDGYYQEYITPQSVQRLIQLCIGSWSSVIGSLRHNTVHIWGEPGESRVLSDQKQRCPASRPALRWCGVYAWHQKIRFRSTKTLCRAGSALHTLGGGLCTLDIIAHMQENAAKGGGLFFLFYVGFKIVGFTSTPICIQCTCSCTWLYNNHHTCTCPWPCRWLQKAYFSIDFPCILNF